MTIKDSTVSWFIRNVLLPRNEIIDNPGFIVLKMGKKREITNLREIVVPESVFVEFEREMIRAYGDRGRQLLYSAGKKFGYRYALASHLPTIKESSDKDLLQFAYFIVRYIESIYSSRIRHEIDIGSRLFKMSMRDYIVCRKNGMGHMLTEGSIAGIWSYVVQNANVEGVQLKCQGRGDAECEVMCAPAAYLKKNGIKFLRETGLEGLETKLPEYNSINAVREARFAKNSLKSIIDGGFIKYSHGTMNYMDERFLLIESSVMYLLEMEMKKAERGLEILWSTGFDWGRNFARKFKKQDSFKFINDLFPGFGFGDFFARPEKGRCKIDVAFFPWAEWVNDVDFTMFRAMLSGIISGMTGKTVELKKIKKTVSRDGFSLAIEE